MKVLLPLAVAVASASMVPTSLAGPSDSAINNANSNAKFLRCVLNTRVLRKRLKKKSALERFYVKSKTVRSLIVQGEVMATAVAAVAAEEAVKSPRPQRFRAQDPLS